MKTKNIFIGLLTALSLNLSALSSWAGSESHGGDGVVDGNKVYLLDLIEAGLEETAFINPQFPADPKIVARLESNFQEFGVFPSQMLASKIAEIQSLHNNFALILVMAMEQIKWNLVRPELVQVADENSPVDLNKLKHIQLAIRTGRDVLINKAGWEKLTDVHKVALILHETLFAMIQTDKKKIGERVVGGNTKDRYGFFQDSRKARSVNGYLFRKSLVNMGREALTKILEPSYSDYLVKSHYKGIFFEGLEGLYDADVTVSFNRWDIFEGPYTINGKEASKSPRWMCNAEKPPGEVAIQFYYDGLLRMEWVEYDSGDFVGHALRYHSGFFARSIAKNSHKFSSKEECYGIVEQALKRRDEYQGQKP